MVDGWLIQRNIQRFRQLLREETDEQKRRILAELLAEEEAKLNDLSRAGGGE
jgi:hypothetical protein